MLIGTAKHYRKIYYEPVKTLTLHSPRLCPQAWVTLTSNAWQSLNEEVRTLGVFTLDVTSGDEPLEWMIFFRDLFFPRCVVLRNRTQIMKYEDF